MENNFDFINFSFFEIDSITDMKNAVMDIFIEDFESGKANFVKTPFTISEFINPHIGGNHEYEFCCWNVPQYSHKIFFISNLGDGWITLCNVLSKKLQCCFYQFAFTNGSNQKTPFFMFHYSSEQGIKRNVLNYKDNKWIFYEKGPVNNCEVAEFYEKRKIRERLNKEILLLYLKNLGISLWDIDNDVADYFVVKRGHKF